MSDYIEREAALALVEPDARPFLAERISQIPAADVRPVVLCRDCVHCVESGEANGEKMCVIDADWCVENGCYYGFTTYTLPDWFCARGKKREES